VIQVNGNRYYTRAVWKRLSWSTFLARDAPLFREERPEFPLEFEALSFMDIWVKPIIPRYFICFVVDICHSCDVDALSLRSLKALCKPPVS
jgi:hypothetical protein